MSLRANPHSPTTGRLGGEPIRAARFADPGPAAARRPAVACDCSRRHFLRRAGGAAASALLAPRARSETILYALGTGLAQGWVAAAHRAAFERGLAAYRSYIDSDGSVRNTCVGCLSPGSGRIADYLAKRPATNDPHAFGPVALAFGVASRLRRAAARE